MSKFLFSKKKNRRFFFIYTIIYIKQKGEEGKKDRENKNELNFNHI